MARAISRLVWPSQTRPATCISFAVSRSRGCMFHLLLAKHRRRQLHPFSAVPDTCPQEKRPQVLLYRARADLQLCRDLFVAAALYQQLQDLFIARCNLDLVQAQHGDSSLILITFPRCFRIRRGCDRNYTEATASPKLRCPAPRDKALRMLHFGLWPTVSGSGRQA